MIPAIIPPLTGLSVLVTRPQPQSDVLASRIRALGGEATILPAIEIRPLCAAAASAHDLVIFASVNAVEHGARLVARHEGMRIAAIGISAGAAGGYVLMRLGQAAFGNVQLPGTLPVLGAGVVLIGAAMAASYLPATRASRVDVLQALRSE